MPRQEKRARQKAARAARLAELQRQQKRKANVRRASFIGVLAIIAVGIFALTGGFSSSSKSSTTTTSSVPTTSTTVSTAQTASNAIAVAAGCPSNPATVLTKAQDKSLPPLTIDASKTYEATVKTDVGTFVITLDPKESPIAVNSFVYLARQKFYNCETFHRADKGFVIQGGDPTNNGAPYGYQFTEHGPPTASPQYKLGAVALANSSSQGDADPSTNGSEFFIVTGSQGEALPPDYVLFGQVTSGMNVVLKINDDGSTTDSTPKVIHRMLSVTITES